MGSLQAAQDFISWLKQSGGSFNDGLELRYEEETGVSVFATRDLDIVSTLITCPSTSAITVETSKHALEGLYPSSSKSTETWNERMLVAVYVILHWIHADKISSREGSVCSMLIGSSSPSGLRHQRYISALPSAKSLLVPLLWSFEERDLLRGTNLFGTILDQEKERQEELKRIQEVIPEVTLSQQYILATAYISSRAFPSRLLSPPVDGVKMPMSSSDQALAGQKEGQTESYPVLLPGLDLFNHSRGTPITWMSTPSSSSSSSGPVVNVSFQNPSTIKADQEVLNNYGPKSNEELLLSYGFVLDSNPDDTLILRLGAPADVAERLEKQGLDVGQRVTLRKDGEIPQDLLRVMRAMMGGPESHVHGEGCSHEHDDGDDEDEEDEHAAHEQEMEELEMEMDVLGTLGGMLEDKLDKLQIELETSPNVRQSVKRMCEIYRQGQIEIILKTQDKLEARIERLERMVDQGMGGCPCGC